MSSSLSSFKIKTITITNKTTSFKSAPAVAAGAPKRLKRPILKNRSSRQRRLAALSFQSPRSATCNRLWSCKGTFTLFGLILLFVSAQFPFSEEEAFHFVQQGKVLHTGEPHQEGENHQSTNKDSDTNTKPKQHTSGLDTALRSAFASNLNHTHLFHNLAKSKSLSSTSNSENNNNIASSPEHNPPNDILLQRARRHVQKDSVEDPAHAFGDKIPFYWQMPPADRVQGILFLAHGCGHDGGDWWPQYSSKEESSTLSFLRGSLTGNSQSSSQNKVLTCSTCRGYPEEMAIVDLARKYFDMVVVSSSAAAEFGKCWKSRDGPRVARVLQHIQSLVGGDIPLYALGASSGGYFVSSLLPRAMTDAGMKLEGFISEISVPNVRPEIRMDNLRAALITMPKDARTQMGVEQFVQDYESTAKHIRVQSHSITDIFFHERIPAIPLATSQRMAEALQKYNLLDASTQMLRTDPAKVSDQWKEALEPFLVPDSGVNLVHLEEVLKVAWGKHEMTRDGVAQALEFITAMEKKAEVDISSMPDKEEEESAANVNVESNEDTNEEESKESNENDPANKVPKSEEKDQEDQNEEKGDDAEDKEEEDS